jgi:hypothetical protein
MGGFRVERPFGWGLLLVGDGADQEVPPLHPGVLVTASSSSIALSFDGVIEVPSGRITLGDADDVEELEVTPGRWRVQVAAEPGDHPEQVDIWITSAA